MGSMITLGLGNLEIDWGKNWGFSNHSRLFVPSDVRLIPYHGWDPDTDEHRITMKEGYARKLRDMVPRLDMMGITLGAAEEEYERIRQQDPSGPDERTLSFEGLKEALTRVDVTELSPEYQQDLELGEMFRLELVERLGLTGLDRDANWATQEVVENFGVEFVLRLLALNSKNLDIDVEWRFADVVNGGWADRDELVAPLSQDEQVLIVTEGSSDAHILKKALDLLRPHTRDFFRFIDMAEGYPFSGTGNLFKFCQGLVKIGVSGRVLIIYDNDTEGCGKFEQTRALTLPWNMHVMRLPDLAALKLFPTLGPDGVGEADINGRAAAIECYLDLAYEAQMPAQVRWTSFDRAQGKYQGELIDKELYAKAFLKLRSKQAGYDYAGLEAILVAIEGELIR
jgi:hypothetical protein